MTREHLAIIRVHGLLLQRTMPVINGPRCWYYWPVITFVAFFYQTPSHHESHANDATCTHVLKNEGQVGNAFFDVPR